MVSELEDYAETQLLREPGSCGKYKKEEEET